MILSLMGLLALSLLTPGRVVLGILYLGLAL